MLLILLACTGTAEETGTSPSPPACWGDAAAATVQTVASGFTDGTEGLAFADGRLFVGTPTQVLELSPDGSTSTLWTNDHVLGLAPGGDGLLVADPGAFSLGGDADGQVWSLGLDGQATLLAEGLSNPNFLVQTPWDTVLLADDTVDGVVELAGGSATPWLPGVPSPNGMVLTQDSITVASTFVAEAPVYRAPVEGQQAGTAEILAHTVAGGANDGMAGAWDGSVFVAVNLAGELWRIEEDGTASAFATGLDSPASLAFGEGEDWDPCSLYVTSLFGEEVVRVIVGPL